jgi:hypothetical protein
VCIKDLPALVSILTKNYFPVVGVAERITVTQNLFFSAEVLYSLSTYVL